MKLSENKRVKFYEEEHRYILDEEKSLIGVTSLMSKHGLSADYTGIDTETLMKAAELGTQAHKTIEAYCDGLPTPTIPLVESFRNLGLKVIRCEYLVSDDECVASSIDLVAQTGRSSVALIDMKRTSTVHKDALAWQLGIYKYLFEKANPKIKVDGCFCLPIKKGNKDDIEKDVCKELVPITPISAEEVERLLECEKNGDIFLPEEKEKHSVEEVLGFTESLALAETARTLADINRKAQELEEMMKVFKETLCDYMAEKNIDEMTCGDIIIKYKKPYERNSIDTARLKKVHPEIYDDYLKTSMVAGSVSITVKQS